MASAHDLGSRHTVLHFMSVATRGSARQTRSQMTHPEVDQPHFQTLVLALRQKPQPAALLLTSRLAVKGSTAASLQGGVVTRSAPHLLWAPLFCLLPPGHTSQPSPARKLGSSPRGTLLSQCLRTDWSCFPVDDDDSFYKYFVSVAEILTKNKLSIISEVM